MRKSLVNRTNNRTWTMPAKDLVQPWEWDKGTIATDMTTLSALQSKRAKASIAATFTLSDVMNSTKLGASADSTSSENDPKRAPFDETLTGPIRIPLEKLRVPGLGADETPEKRPGLCGSAAQRAESRGLRSRDGDSKRRCINGRWREVAESIWARESEETAIAIPPREDYSGGERVSRE